jgi:membrane protein
MIPAPLLALREAAQSWIERDAFQHAGALAFFTLFSLAPLVIILVTIVGAVFGAEAATGEISRGISNLVGPQAAQAVEEAVRLSRPETAGILPALIGIGALLFGATTVFAQMQSSLNQFWGVRATPARSGIVNFFTVRLLSLGMVLVIGFLLLTSFALSVGLTWALEHTRYWIPIPSLVLTMVDIVLSLVVTTVLLGLLFKVLPDVRLGWSDVRRGALFTALLFVMGKYLIAFYLTKVAPASTFGAAGSLVLILFWVYYSSLILFFGTALTKVLVVRRDGMVTPKPTAVRVTVTVEKR